MKYDPHPQDIQDLDTLREALTPLDRRCPLPARLEARHIAGRLPAGKPKIPPALILRRAAALAVAVVLTLTGAVISDRLNLFSGRLLRLPAESPSAFGDSGGTDFGTSYYDLERAFLRLQKRVAREKVNGFLEDLASRNWGAKAEMAAPGELFEAELSDTAGKTGHGQTNNQVQGVDEADILKNDGTYLYYVTNSLNTEAGGVGRLVILRAKPKLEVLCTISLPDYRSDVELYVQGDRLALLYTEYPPGGDSLSSVRIYDVTDRENPLLVKTFSQKGKVLSSRLVGGRLYLLSTEYVYLDFRVKGGVIPEEEILPVVYHNSEPQTLPASKIALMPDAEEPSYLLISSLDLQSSKAESESAAILGAGSQVYCNTEALFVACQQYDTTGGLMRRWGVAAKTLIYRFDLLPGGTVKAGAGGEVPGAPLNQFSMDEYGGYFRIATTGNRESDKSSEIVNFVTVLDKDLQKVGGLENLAPGERIQSARFLGGMGYLVTFRQTDPLFVIDLTDPKAPKVAGELKLPGFSAYLHPWGDRYLIGIGPDGTEDGTTDATKISLFDISNPAQPKEISRLVAEKTWTTIQQDHKQFVVCGEKSLFGLPLQNYESYDTDRQGGSSSFFTFRVKDGQLVKDFRLETVEPIEPILDSWGGKYYYDSRTVFRGTYTGDQWFIFSGGSAAAYGMADGKLADSVTF
ncbi:MAG: beta-propeller domain-containing protein [Oscillospiraceae bacterium]|jgi:uncharacterized secreted protein with C-terminal beta-propeller domain|nr:beta-propeller domain-containing protein [Oscillospiraceae bacterium]